MSDTVTVQPGPVISGPFDFSFSESGVEKISIFSRLVLLNEFVAHTLGSF